MRNRGVVEQHGKSVTMARSQLVIREGQTGSRRMADRPVVAKKLLKGGGAKGPWSGTMNEEGKARRLA
jgi:hypothetical protein